MINGKRKDSLPEFNDRRAAISKLFTGQVAECGVSDGAVLAVALPEDLNTVLCVPGVVAGGPGQCGVEGLDEVVETPGQNHNVVRVAEEHNHHGGIAKS